MKSFTDIKKMSDTSSEFDQLFEQFMEKGVDLALENTEVEEVNEAKDKDDQKMAQARNWIIKQVEDTDKPHDEIKKAFLKKYPGSEAFFDKVVKEIV